jgi:hypothetical protein
LARQQKNPSGFFLFFCTYILDIFFKNRNSSKLLTAGSAHRTTGNSAVAYRETAEESINDHAFTDNRGVYQREKILSIGCD